MTCHGDDDNGRMICRWLIMIMEVDGCFNDVDDDRWRSRSLMEMVMMHNFKCLCYSLLVVVQLYGGLVSLWMMAYDEENDENKAVWWNGGGRKWSYGDGAARKGYGRMVVAAGFLRFLGLFFCHEMKKMIKEKEKGGWPKGKREEWYNQRLESLCKVLALHGWLWGYTMIEFSSHDLWLQVTSGNLG